MKNIFKSLAEFQQEVPVIHKSTQGYGYSYADLPTIFEVINPLLKKHGLGFTQLIMSDCIKTIIFHIESGDVLESLTEIPKNVSLKGMNDFQVLGSAITYIRRYALSSALGLVTDKDTDAGGEQTTLKKPKAKDELIQKGIEKSNGDGDKLQQLIDKFDLTTEQLELINKAKTIK
jgi:hypothetical protein